MSNGIGIFPACNFDLPFSNDWSSQRRAHQIDAFVNGVGFHRRPDVLAHELFAQICDVEPGGAGRFRFFVEPVDLCALPHIGAVTDDFALVLLFQPAKHHRCVEAARVGENYLLDSFTSHFLYRLNEPLRHQDTKNQIELVLVFFVSSWLAVFIRTTPKFSLSRLAAIFDRARR